MDISDLKAFVVLAETLNFTRSAEALYISQSTFSRQISRLEAEIGMPLFIRTPRSVALTEAGSVFLPEAKAQLSAWESSLRHMEQVRSGRRGSLTIGYIHDNPNIMFPDLIRAFRRACPDVELTLKEYGQDAIAVALDRGEVDLCFGFLESLTSFETFAVKELGTAQICAVLPAEHPLSGRDSICLGELAGEPLVVISQDVSLMGYQDVLERCRRAGFVPEIAATPNIVPSLFMLVEAGLGFAFLPESAGKIAPEGVSFIPLSDCQDAITTVLGWRKDHSSAILKSFLEIAEGMCGNTSTTVL